MSLLSDVETREPGERSVFAPSSRVKVAHVTATDGSLRYLLLNQLKYMADRGYEVITVSSPGANVPHVTSGGFAHHAVPIRRSVHPWADLVALRRLKRLFQRESVTIVHTHTPKPGLLGQLAARAAGVPIVVNTLHGFYFNDETPRARRLFFESLERIAGRQSDAILSQNAEDVETAIRRRIVPSDRIQLLGNGIDLTRFDPAKITSAERQRAREELRLPRQRVIGFVGRHVREKGLPELFAALSRVRQDFPDVKLLLVGRLDNDRGDVAGPDQARQAGVADLCYFAGVRQDVPLMLSLMDVLVLPSHREGFPRAPMEAAAMGRPVIVTDTRGCRQTVDRERTGLLVPIRDPPSLADAILRLLRDPEGARRMGQLGRQKAVREFDERAVFRRVVETYERLLHRQGIAKTPPRFDPFHETMLRAAGRVLRSFDIPPLRWLDRSWWQREAEAGSRQTQLPFVAVVGPPRVGSTLMYQLLVTYFDFFFFDNLQHALLRYPYLAFRLSHCLPRRRPPQFESDHGFVTGLHGPSEANFFWPLWCRMPMVEQHFTNLGTEEDRARRAMVVQFFDAVARRTRRPMTNAYNAHAFYLEELADWFARLIVIHLRRDPIDNAVSIYRARQQLRRAMTDWWSIQPAPCRLKQGLDEFDQIVCQIVETHRAVDRQRRARPDLRIVDVDYELLVQNPEKILLEVQSAAAEGHLQLRQSGRPVPDHFPMRRLANDQAEVREAFQDRFSRVGTVF